MASERKSGLEIGVDAAKMTQDAIGPASRRPTSCGFADGVIGTACNPLKPWVTSDNSQYVNTLLPVPANSNDLARIGNCFPDSLKVGRGSSALSNSNRCGPSQGAAREAGLFP